MLPVTQRAALQFKQINAQHSARQFKYDKMPEKRLHLIKSLKTRKASVQMSQKPGRVSLVG
jgi:hypothetical protein